MISFPDIVTAAKIARFGAYDFAVPEQWLMQDPANRREFLWFYPSRSRSIFGRPLSYRAAARLAVREERRKGIPDLYLFLHLWAYSYPGKALDTAGLDAIRHFLNSEPDCTHGLVFLLIELEFPPPPPGFFPHDDPSGIALAA